MDNKYESTCHACGKIVKPGKGKIEGYKRNWKVWCMECYNASDNSSEEDRCCGNRAYEDLCAQRCGM